MKRFRTLFLIIMLVVLCILAVVYLFSCQPEPPIITPTVTYTATFKPPTATKTLVPTRTFTNTPKPTFTSTNTPKPTFTKEPTPTVFVTPTINCTWYSKMWEQTFYHCRYGWNGLVIHNALYAKIRKGK